MSDAGQVTSIAAEFYEEFFVPALFAQWVPPLMAAAEIRAGQRVLDVACGTGVATLAAAGAVGPSGAAVGIDLNAGMIAVARGKAPDLEWYEGAAEALPFDDASFDAVMSQFGLMFFADQSMALREMWRVLRPAGRLAVAVWGSLEQTPGYAGVTALLGRLFGDAVANLLCSPYSLGGVGQLESLMTEAGISGARVQLVPGTARFSSIRSWIECDVRGWTLAEHLDDAQFERLVAEAETELMHLVNADRGVEFAHPALIASAVKSAGA